MSERQIHRGKTDVLRHFTLNIKILYLTLGNTYQRVDKDIKGDYERS
jgi:hypothetical protein